MPNLQLWWTYDEASGSVLDASGNARHGTPFNGVALGAAGKLGRAASFDGVNDYVKTTAWAYGASVSVAAWIKFSSQPNFGVIASTGIGSGSVGGWTLYTKPTGSGGTWAFQPQAADGTDAGELVGPTLNTFLGQWVHLAATFDGNNIALYLNGAAAGTRTNAKAGAASTLDFMSGANNPGSPGNLYSGLIDDLRVYSDVLTAAQITALYLGRGQANLGLGLLSLGL
jgi:hypothetical protein